MNASRKRAWPSCVLILGLGFALLLAAYGGAHWGYYGLPLEERSLDPRHGLLRPSGRNGLLFGLVGTGAMVLNLTYLVRKRLGAATWLGALPHWMRFHVLTGLAGPALVLLHTAFAPTSALGSLAFVAMIVVVVTGIIGRYLYIHVPRSYRGRELELGEVRQRLVHYREELEALGVEAVWLETPSVPGLERADGTGVLSSLRSVLAGDREARRQFCELRQRILENRGSGANREEILGLLRQLCQERQWLLRYHELRGLMGSWRFFHRWLAIVFLLVVAFHIALALQFGGLWLFQGGR